MSMKERISASLAILNPVELDVIDDSEKHRGHGGWREGGETHFQINIRAAAFDGLSRVERHRRINALLTAEFERGLHALALSVKGTGDA